MGKNNLLTCLFPLSDGIDHSVAFVLVQNKIGFGASIARSELTSFVLIEIFKIPFGMNAYYLRTMCVFLTLLDLRVLISKPGFFLFLYIEVL